MLAARRCHGTGNIYSPETLVGKGLARTGRDRQVGFGRIHMSPFMRIHPTPKIVHRSGIDSAMAQLEKIDVPHLGLPSLLTARPPKASGRRRELRETPLRLIAFGCQSTSWPATRSRRRRLAERNEPGANLPRSKIRGWRSIGVTARPWPRTPGSREAIYSYLPPTSLPITRTMAKLAAWVFVASTDWQQHS